MHAPEMRQILEEYADLAKGILRRRRDESAPIETFDAEMRKAPGYAEALTRVGFRNAPSDLFRATSKFVNLFGDFKQVRKVVYLEAKETTDDEIPQRPTIIPGELRLRRLSAPSAQERRSRSAAVGNMTLDAFAG